MQTSLNELIIIEQFLLSNPGEAEKILMQARVILQPELDESIYWQEKSYELVNVYGREKLRKEIQQIHQQLFSYKRHRNFRNWIMRIFTK
ncbi:hypothetical protein DHW03_15155 [Pedobacter yonginense]|uniref:Uncharacterized protein n=1 Tax=Pedobacter yonginense TaxID=651869 RepID=A0A317EHK1_9SPHI|nr:hypothetical protein DHW03_15155 [Pedobacter yonginense]